MKLENSNPLMREAIYLKSFYAATFLSALAAYIFAYGFEITNFLPSIDEEYKDNFKGTLSFGRWGHALLRNYILPEPFVPYFTILTAILLLSATATISSRLIGFKGITSISFAILMVALPQAAYQLEFSNQAETISIAFLASAASIYFLDKFSFKNFILLSTTLIIPASIYQSILFFPLSLALIKIAYSSVHGDENIKSSAKKISFLFLAMAYAVFANYITTKIIQSYYKAPQASYISNMIYWGNYDSIYLIKNLFWSIVNALSGKNYEGLNLFSATIISFFTCIIMVFRVREGSRLTFIIAISMSVISPFTLTFLTGTELSPRTSTQLPIVFAGISAIAISTIGAARIGLAISIIALISGGAISNSLMYSDYMARVADINTANRMVAIAHYKYPEFNEDKIPVYFYGSFTPKNSWKTNSRADVFGASFFSWDGGNNKRIYAFLSTSNIAEFKRPTDAQINKAIEHAKTMKPWPSSSSIELNDGVLIIKLGEKLNKYNW